LSALFYNTIEKDGFLPIDEIGSALKLMGSGTIII